MRDLLALLVPPEISADKSFAESIEKAQSLLAAAQPDVLVAIDAGWRPRAFAVGGLQPPRGAGGLYRSQAVPAMAQALIDTAIDFGLPAFAEDAPLTRETAAALQQLWPAEDLPILALGVATASPSLLQEFGQAIAAAGQRLGLKVVAICVGAIARDHQAEHDRRENPAVRQFGEQVLERLARSGGEEVFDIDGGLWVQAHPETELGHLALLLGTTGVEAECEVLGSWAGPGVFAATVAFYRAEGFQLAATRDWDATDHPKPTL